MDGRFTIRNASSKRTIYLKMSGTFTAEQMRNFVSEYNVATDTYKGRKHLVMADMRGMKPNFPEVAEIFGGAILYGRKNGAVRCAHLSDDTIIRLQAARVARKNSPGDDITVDVVSEDEAERVLDEARQKLEKSDAA